MNAQEIFFLARQYGAEHPGITFDLAVLLRYTRKVQEIEQDRCCGIVFGMAGSDNVAQRTVDAIKGNHDKG